MTVHGQDNIGNWLIPTSSTWNFTTADVAKVSGTIIDQNGDPIANATVTLMYETSPSGMTGASSISLSVVSTIDHTLTTTTDASGHYAFYDLAIGNYTITATRDGYNIPSSSVSVTQSTVESGGKTVDETLTAYSNGSNNDTVIIVGVILVLAVLIGAFLLIRHRKKDCKNNKA